MKKTAPQNVSKEHFDDVSNNITKFGTFIRKTSIDELPQLFNIFIGNMSFVGPRPILWNCVEWIEEREKYGAHNIRPGMTGLAQCSGRDTLDIKKKSEFDGYYYQNMSISLDTKIILKTIKVVLSKQGIIEEKQG